MFMKYVLLFSSVIMAIISIIHFINYNAMSIIYFLISLIIIYFYKNVK